MAKDHRQQMEEEQPNHQVESVVITEPGDASVLEIQPRPVRSPGFGEVAVEVAFAGLNRADVMQRRGFYPAPPDVPADVPGLEFAGKVAQLGPGVQGFELGQQVMGIVGGGGCARRLVVHSRELLPVPKGMKLEQAAAIPEVFMTAFDALVRQAELRSGETVLIHAAASGVGSAALQIVQALGARAIGTSRSAGKKDRLETLGLAHFIHTPEPVFANAVKALGGGGADVVLDTIGASYLAENLRSLAPGGRIVHLGLLGGATGELPMGLLLAKRARLLGSVLRSRPLEEKASLTQAFRRQILPLFEAGVLTPVIDRVMPMTQIRQVHELMESNTTFGKVVLAW